MNKTLSQLPHQPLVSVIIPAYNMADYTVLTVESVLKQTYPHVEVLVIDDGSKDDTAAKLLPFGEKIQYHHQLNGGACSARNYGIRLAKGEILAFVDCDDLYHPEKIAVGVNYFQQNPDVGLLHTAVRLVDGQGAEIRTKHLSITEQPKMIHQQLVQGNFIHNPTVMVRRACFDTVDGFDEALFPPADWDMWLRISEQYLCGYIDLALSDYRVVSQGCFRQFERTMRESRLVIDRYFRRQPQASFITKRQAYGRWHLNNAMGFIIKDENKAAWRSLWSAAYQTPWQWKVWVLVILLICHRKLAVAKLRKSFLLDI